VANAQNKTTAGFLNPTIYAAKAKSAFRDITSGDNGAFKAGTGWDACTGLGSPIGTAIAKLLARARPSRKRSPTHNKPQPPRTPHYRKRTSR
jgi:kumamolisin